MKIKEIRECLALIHRFAPLMVVMVPKVLAYVQTHQAVPIKYASLCMLTLAKLDHF